MINKIIFLLFLSFVFISCGEVTDNATAIDLKITPLSAFDGMVSFQVTAQKTDKDGNISGKLYKSCKNYAESKEVTFNLDESGDYVFKFSGYVKNDCSGNREWLGKSLAKINVNDINNVKIPVSKIDSFVFSSVNIHQGVAFMDTIMVNDDIILSGGASSVKKTLRRIKDLQCDESNTDGSVPKCSTLTLDDEVHKNWICNTDSSNNITSCYDIITEGECKAQWQIDGTPDIQETTERCERCLVVKDHKFESPDSACYISECLINNEGYGCSLKGRVFLQKIDTNNLSSGFLRDKNNNILKLSETRILHDSVSVENNTYFIGGAPEITISKNAPFIHPKKTGRRINLIDVYNKGIISNFSLNTDYNNDILVDFNVFRTDDKFFVLNGRKDEFFNDNSFFKKVIECDVITTDCHFVNADNSDQIYSIGSGATETVDNGGTFISWIAGGISGLLNNYKVKYDNSLKIKGTPVTFTFGNLYKPKVFYNNDKIYIVGGFKFSRVNGEIEFNGFSNQIYVYNQVGEQVAAYDIADAFKDTVFSQIVSYNYKDKEGILFVGGLKKDQNGDFDAINDVAFVGFDDITATPPLAFEPLSALNKPRFGHSVIIDKYNKIWVMGGLTNIISEDNHQMVKGDFFVDKTIEIYTPSIDADK